MNNDKFKTVLDKSEKNLTLVVFTSAWSGGSQLLQYNLEDIQQEGMNIVPIYFDIKKHADAAVKLNVSTVPTTIAFYQREVQDRYNGVIPKHLLRSKLSELMQRCGLRNN